MAYVKYCEADECQWNDGWCNLDEIWLYPDGMCGCYSILVEDEEGEADDDSGDD